MGVKCSEWNALKGRSAMLLSLVWPIRVSEVRSLRDGAEDVQATITAKSKSLPSTIHVLG